MENQKKIMACNEKIITEIKNALEYELELQEINTVISNDPDEVCMDENLIKSYELCNRILDYDYFNRSESYLNKLINKGKGVNIVWKILYNIDLHIKKNDMRRLFKLIVNNSEDWC